MIVVFCWFFIRLSFLLLIRHAALNSINVVISKKTTALCVFECSIRSSSCNFLSFSPHLSLRVLILNVNTLHHNITHWVEVLQFKLFNLYCVNLHKYLSLYVLNFLVVFSMVWMPLNIWSTEYRIDLLVIEFISFICVSYFGGGVVSNDPPAFTVQ